MPGFPDWQKVTAWTFPSVISAAEATSDIGQQIGTGTHTIKSYTDGKTRILYSLQLAGSLQSKEAANRTLDITLGFTRGLDDGGTPFNVYSARRQAIATATTYDPTARDFDFVLVQPFLFVAGSIATPNVFQIALSTSSAVDLITWGVNLITWPIA